MFASIFDSKVHQVVNRTSASRFQNQTEQQIYFPTHFYSTSLKLQKREKVYSELMNEQEQGKLQPKNKHNKSLNICKCYPFMVLISASAIFS